MNATEAQNKIDSKKKVSDITQDEWDSVSPLKVDYNSIDNMPLYLQKRIKYCVDWIVGNYSPDCIDLVMSHVNGYPIYENTPQDLFEAKKSVFGKAKLSDYDFIVPSIDKPQIIEQITPLIKVDMFKRHHNNVKKIRVYELL